MRSKGGIQARVRHWDTGVELVTEFPAGSDMIQIHTILNQGGFVVMDTAYAKEDDDVETQYDKWKSNFPEPGPVRCSAPGCDRKEEWDRALTFYTDQDWAYCRHCVEEQANIAAEALIEAYLNDAVSLDLLVWARGFMLALAESV